MHNPTKPDSSRRGVAIVEFSLSLVFLTPLLLGTLVFGFKLIRSIEMGQVTRDLGHMYIRGINFRDAIPIQNAQTMAAQYSLTSTGSSVIYLSQIRIATQADCDAANPTTPGATCTNKNKPIFVEQVTLGNASCGRSAFGTPPLDSGQKVTVVDLGNNSTAQATNFTTVLSPNVGEFAYVAEMINLTPELNIPGMTGAPQVYSRTIF
jgi:hypothetical protein